MTAVAAARAGQRIGRHDAQNRSIKVRAAIFILLAVALVFAGGASRYDEPSQILVRLAAIAAIAAIAVALWPLHSAPLRSGKRWLGAVGALYLLVLVQLVPLPPGIWSQLPGRGIYAEIAEASGAVGWRPLSLTPDLTLNALFALLPATAAGLVALYGGSRGRRRLWLLLVVAALFSAMLGLVQLAMGGEALRLYRETSAESAVGLFANRNHQAAFLACALPPLGALAGLRLRNTGEVAPVAVLALAALALLLLSLVATASRSGILLGAIGTIGGIWCFAATGEKLIPAGIRARLAVAAIAVGVMAAISLAAVRTGVVERFAQTDPASDIRVEMIEPLLRTAAAFMPWGSGFGSFDGVYRRFEPDHLLSTIYMNQAHNEPLQLAIEGGIPALLLLGLFLLWWSVTAVRLVRGGIPSKRRAFALAAMTVTAILMLASLIDYPLRTPLLGAVFMLACIEMMRAAALRNAPRSAGEDRS